MRKTRRQYSINCKINCRILVGQNHLYIFYFNACNKFRQGLKVMIYRDNTHSYIQKIGFFRESFFTREFIWIINFFERFIIGNAFLETKKDPFTVLVKSLFPFVSPSLLNLLADKRSSKEHMLFLFRVNSFS